MKFLRTSLGLTQQEFGAQIGVSRDVISNIEGNRAKLRPTLLRHICKCFNVNEEWLLYGKGETFRPSAGENPQLREAMQLFTQLDERYQVFALEQVKALLKLQNMK